MFPNGVHKQIGEIKSHSIAIQDRTSERGVTEQHDASSRPASLSQEGLGREPLTLLSPPPDAADSQLERHQRQDRAREQASRAVCGSSPIEVRQNECSRGNTSLAGVMPTTLIGNCVIYEKMCRRGWH